MLRLASVTKRYPNGTSAVQELSLEVEEGEVCVLVGPSGCGKTTTMKMVNRLVEPSSGRIFLGGDDVTHVDPVVLRRRIGYVIQQVGLFPHMTVGDNVATVPRLLGWGRTRTSERVDELLELVGLEPSEYRDRYPDQLSGGQRQRVGVARALGADPPVLLMDEPFGAVDPIARARLQREFLRLQAAVRKTVVFVTHDIDEAVVLGDRIAILREGGHLEQHGTPEEVLARPASPFVADFVGADRAVKQLGVTFIDTTRLEHLPTVTPSTSLAEARAAMDAAGARWSVVLDGQGRATAGLERAHADGDGAVGAHVAALGDPIDAGATLREALASLLLQDVPWVAVADQGRHVGVFSAASIHAAARHPAR